MLDRWAKIAILFNKVIRIRRLSMPWSGLT